MLKLYGPHELPNTVNLLRVGGVCPHCGVAARFGLTSGPPIGMARATGMTHFVLGYACDACFGPIPIKWEIDSWETESTPRLNRPEIVLPVKRGFEFAHVPDPVRDEVDEALRCLSVGATNGFAAMTRRAVQAICTDLGADATSKVKRQIEAMFDMTGLDDDWRELATQVMLGGHDGSHPHLPNVDQGRAELLLSMLQDLTYELYTRPGKVKEAAEMRQEAIETKRHTDA